MTLWMIKCKFTDYKAYMLSDKCKSFNVTLTNTRVTLTFLQMLSPIEHTVVQVPTATNVTKMPQLISHPSATVNNALLYSCC